MILVAVARIELATYPYEGCVIPFHHTALVYLSRIELEPPCYEQDARPSCYRYIISMEGLEPSYLASQASALTS